MTTDRPETRVGHILYDGARFCGRGVFDELMSELPSGDELAATALGMRLDPGGREVWQRCAIALLSPDARVWPLKTVRVIASLGNPTAAFFGGQLVSSSPAMGPGAARGTAEMLTAIAETAMDLDDVERVSAATLDVLARSPRLGGFGVPFRAEDERMLALRASLAGHAAEQGRFYRLHLKVGSIVAAHRGVQPNLVLTLAALLLDLGCAPRRAGLAVALLMRPSFAAHAVEAADRDGPLLRELPPERLDYRGKAPRRIAETR
ncbi:MAG: citrate/2-methylcitrate synthase [Byssovorax sp.]